MLIVFKELGDNNISDATKLKKFGNIFESMFPSYLQHLSTIGKEGPSKDLSQLHAVESAKFEVLSRLREQLAGVDSQIADLLANKKSIQIRINAVLANIAANSQKRDQMFQVDSITPSDNLKRSSTSTSGDFPIIDLEAEIDSQASSDLSNQLSFSPTMNSTMAMVGSKAKVSKLSQKTKPSSSISKHLTKGRLAKASGSNSKLLNNRQDKVDSGLNPKVLNSGNNNENPDLDPVPTKNLNNFTERQTKVFEIIGNCNGLETISLELISKLKPSEKPSCWICEQITKLRPNYAFRDIIALVDHLVETHKVIIDLDDYGTAFESFSVQMRKKIYPSIKPKICFASYRQHVDDFSWVSNSTRKLITHWKKKVAVMEVILKMDNTNGIEFVLDSDQFDVVKKSLTLDICNRIPETDDEIFKFVNLIKIINLIA